jgi:Mitochondrial 28S ribosomal protein S31
MRILYLFSRIPISSATFLLSKTFCDKKNDGKETSKPHQPEEKAKKAKDSLNKLLASMNTNHEVGLKKIELRKPGAARKQKKQMEKQNDDGSSSEDEKKPKTIQEAVKKVASTIDGGQQVVGKEVESELLRKLLNISEGSSSNLSDIFSNILVDREDKKPTSSFVRRQQADGDVSRAERVRRNLESGRPRFNDKQGGGYDKRGRDNQRPPREQIRVLQTNM